jgi:hypothetical protein
MLRWCAMMTWYGSGILTSAWQRLLNELTQIFLFVLWRAAHGCWAAGHIGTTS